jgi:hypothetical protein
MARFFSIKAKAPELEGEWSPRNDVRFCDVSYGSHIKRWWVCPKGHTYSATPNSRTNIKSGCPFCRGLLVSEENSLLTMAPELAVQWHHKNMKKFAEVSYGSRKQYWWVCDQGHEWLATPNDRVGAKSECPWCSGKLLSDMNSLKSLAPVLELEWDRETNIVKFEDVFCGSNTKYGWVCLNRGHKWKASAGSRFYMKSGCPHCANKHSRAELEIYAIVQKHFPEAQNGVTGLLSSRRLELDIWLPSLRKAIEYDGWHHRREKAQTRDARKDRECQAAGIELLRIKETDYESAPKAVVDSVLSWLHP